MPTQPTPSADPNQYRSAIAEYIRRQAQPPDKFAHQPRLYQLARSLAEEEPFDDDVLYAAAWMHDLGVFTGHRPEDPDQLASWDHIAYTARQVPELLQSLGFPAAKIPAVIETIRTHLPSGEPTSIEGVLLRDADILEQLGAIGILRMVSKVGRDTRYSLHGDAVRMLGKNAQELPSRLRLPSAQRLAKKRLTLMEDFLEAVEWESAGQLY
jgi:uncharacterized protein